MQTIYKCEGCGQEFDSWQKCGEHENAHVEVKTSQLLFNQGDSYPEVIKVVFGDGSSGNYVLLGDISPAEEKDLDPALKKFAEIKAELKAEQKESLPATTNSAEGHEK